MQFVKLEIAEEGSTPTVGVPSTKDRITEMLQVLYKEFPSATPNRKHLARNYAQLLMELLDSTQFHNQQVAHHIRSRLKAVESISQLSVIFQEFSGFVEFLESFVLTTPVLLESICSNDKIVPDERVAMLESYPQFVWGLRHPTEFLSFTDENKHYKLSKFEELSRRASCMNYSQILREVQEISRQLLEAEPPTCQHTKHITQLWLNRIKGCLTEASLTSFFEQRVDEYPIREIIDRLRNSRKIKLHTFKAFLGFPEIQNYVSEHLLKNNVMLKQILEDVRMDVKTKLTLVQKYPLFVGTLKDPQSLRSWRNRSHSSEQLQYIFNA